jgi:DNA topoisomerase-1
MSDDIKTILSDGGLMIVESPTKAREISGFLGSKWLIMPTKGFMFELKDPKKLSKDEKQIYGSYSINVSDGSYDRLLDHDPQNRKQWNEIRDAVRSGRWKHFYVSTDPDEAGELIGYEVADSLKNDLKKQHMDVRRASWHEITKKAVLAGLEAYGSVDTLKAQSAQARQEYDRLFGFSVSPYLWKTVGSGTSGGRAQSPALRLVVDREKERIRFIPSEYGSIDAVFNEGRPNEITASLVEWNGRKMAGSGDFTADGKLKNKGKIVLLGKDLQQAVSDLKTLAYTITDITERPYARRPPVPYTTSSYQQNVGSLLGLSASRSMTIAQQLFEHTYQTYSRTDSPAMASEAINAARAIIRKQYGGKMPAKPIVYKSKSKNAQEGHECIRPVIDEATGVFYAPSKIRRMTGGSAFDDKAGDVYDLVYRRSVASQMDPARGVTKKITITSTDGKAVFTTASTRIDDPGFLKVYDDGRRD